jgi:hypothetical protein
VTHKKAAKNGRIRKVIDKFSEAFNKKAVPFEWKEQPLSGEDEHN